MQKNHETNTKDQSTQTLETMDNLNVRQLENMRLNIQNQVQQEAFAHLQRQWMNDHQHEVRLRSRIQQLSEQLNQYEINQSDDDDEDPTSETSDLTASLDDDDRYR